MENKKIYITLFIISIIFLGIGGTLAALTTSSTLLNISQIRSGNLTMTVDGGGSENVSLFPSACTSEHAIKKTIKASAVNTSGGKVSFSIGMNVAVLGDDLKRNTMKYALSTSADSCTDGLIANGNFSNATVGGDIWIVKNDYDNITNSGNTYTKTYYLYIWLDQIETQNLSGSISVNMKGTSSNNPNLTTEAEIEKILLYDTIKNAADTTKQIDFSKTSVQDNTNGIYMTTDTEDNVPVYYYRGNVDNRVIFANFCWRIVRTTETGGVKLIYDGVPSNGQCNNTGSNSTIGSSAFNSTYNDNAYVGYMFGTAGSSTYASTHANTNDSTIKKKIDNWYKNNMTSYTLQLEDTVWCNDRSIVTDLANSNGGYYSSYTTFGYGTNKTIYGPTSRVGYNVSNPTPTLKCAQDNDKFTVNTSNGNGALTYPVGLITADEMAYAGGVYGSSNKNSSFYLYTGQWYWALSPFAFYDSGAGEFGLGSSGRLSNDVVYFSYGVRPSVSLQPGIAKTGGSGTAADPFIVE